jgi:hypothetical protein
VLFGAALRDAHTTFAFVLIFTNAIIGIWGLLLDREVIRKSKLFWFCTAIAQSLIFVQATLGVLLQTSDDLEPKDFHYLYGFSMIIAVALLYGYRTPIGKHKFMLYSLGSFFIMGLGIRAMFLGT